MLSIPLRIRTRTASAILLAVALATAGCGGEAATGGPPGSQAVTVEVDEARLDTLSVRLSSVGSLEADNIVEIRPETDGMVARIPVTEGEQVDRGEVLVELDGRELAAEKAAAEAAVRRARTELDNLETRLERNRGLYEKGAISAQTLDDLEASRNTAAARLEEARAQRDLAARRLEKTVLRAPFRGKADARSLYPGDFVREGEALFTLVDDDPLRVEFSVPEQYVDRLELGSAVSVRVRSLPEERFSGEVVFVSPRVEPTSRTVALKAAVPNSEGRLRAGQFAEVELELERRTEALVVPESAVVPRGGENFLFVVDDQGKARERSVELGARQSGRVEIRSGLSAGERVVLAGQQRLRDGSDVEVVDGVPGGPGDAGDGGEAGGGDGGPPPTGGDGARDDGGADDGGEG